MDELEIATLKRSLKPLIDEAKEKGLWLHLKGYAWLSPYELEKEQVKGHYTYDKKYWILGDPQDKVKELEDEIKRKQDELETFKSRIESNLKIEKKLGGCA